MITLWPKFSLVDKITKINVFRLKPLQKITLGARVVGDSGQVFDSHAHFIATKHGQVDVCKQLVKSDVTKPYKVVLDCFDGHTDPQESSSLQPLSSNTFEKGYMADGVKRIPVREGRIRGTLFLPPGDGPFPGE